MMDEARARDTGRLALAVGAVAVGSVACLATFFVVGGPFGTINDIGNAATGVLSAALAWRLRSQLSARTSNLVVGAALLGAGITVVGSTLVVSGTTGFFFAGLVSSIGFAAIGTWLVVLNRSMIGAATMAPAASRDRHRCRGADDGRHRGPPGHPLAPGRPVDGAGLGLDRLRELAWDLRRLSSVGDLAGHHRDASRRSRPIGPGRHGRHRVMDMRPLDAAISPAATSGRRSIRAAALMHVALGVGFGIGTAIAAAASRSYRRIADDAVGFPRACRGTIRASRP